MAVGSWDIYANFPLALGKNQVNLLGGACVINSDHGLTGMARRS